MSAEPLHHSMTQSPPRAIESAPAARAEPRAFAIGATLWIAALWLMCRPFRGIRHDSILYIGQTFNAATPSSRR
jgi:hypothetical protein